MEIVIDPITEADWEHIRAIYLDGIATGQATFEVDAPAWEDWNANHLSICRLAGRLDGRLIAWAALSPVSRRKCYAGVAEVSVYVHSSYRSSGAGKTLLEALIKESETQ